MTVLEDIIKEHIRKNGPMDIGSFMAMALGHPDHGYYMTRDPLGRGGDFTTAPEISQMFGELVGAWVADTWIKIGRPSPFILLECGPGRGTLMADMLRATRQVDGFHDAVRIILLETSPILIEKQKEILADYRCEWIGNIDHATISSSHHPMIVIANEFLDALPVRHRDGAGKERVIALKDDELVFEGGADIYEYSPAREMFVKSVVSLLKQRGGAALFIDYGHDNKGVAGDTLQAIKDHKFVSVLDHIGEADLTAHVDFSALAEAAVDINIHGPVEQGAFLKRLGIEMRAHILMKAAAIEQRNDIQSALSRLTSPEQMGRLFKVMALCGDDNISLAGF